MSDKLPYIIYTDMEPLIKRIDGCEDNPKSSSTTKIGEYIPFGNSTIWAFNNTLYHTLYRGEDCMKKFCSSLREHATNIILNFIQKQF